MTTSAELADRTWRGWMTYVAEASELLAGTLDPGGIVALTAQIVVPRLADWCVAYTAESTSPAYVWHTDEDRSDALKELLAVEGRPAEGPPVPWGNTDLACTIPLVARGRTLGVICVGRSVKFPPDHYELAEEIVRRAALALDNALLYAEQKATSLALQRSLLPPGLPDLPGFDVAVSYRPAGEGAEVGGDFYDVFTCPPGPDGEPRWRFAIGDVCGTGPEAASVTGLARHALRILSGEGMPLPDVVERLNRLIIDEGPRGRLLTLLHGELTASGALTLVCAGHPLPLILAPDGTVTEAANPQPLLGVIEEIEFTVDNLTLRPGHVLFSCTDGVTERRDGDVLLGDADGLETILARCAGLSAGAVAAAVERAVDEFSAEPGHDDMAIVVLRANG
ncbi:serine/threonine-protein phosphatase [Actinocorallia sp. API 0066]|uniref:PP2C family protein-serine/threonine phosphatase n=1 Tax=Actinocorallia sp. API 0066 TaxID=2896846 RepID=UPI001E5E0654|nr:PP2C family protein-serine/threonine phosphatase [Actinocorallia sp. API 0066]MCD0452903.1 serine/threonine-protein phosphatase [Actinocorallia sp. API 0066]